MDAKFVAIAVVMFAAITSVPARAALPNGVWWPVPGTLSPAGAPETRRVAVRPIPSDPALPLVMITITYDCGAPTPCTTPEVLAAPWGTPPSPSVFPKYVTVTPLPPSAPRARFVFMWAPGGPCVDPRSRFAADSYAGVWTGGPSSDFGECFGKLPAAPPGVRPDTRGFHKPNRPIQLPLMPALPPMRLPPSPAIPGHKPS